MLTYAIVYAATVAAGLIAAQLVRTGYAAFSSEELGMQHLLTPGFAQPLRALVVVGAAPALLMAYALSALASRPANSAVAAVSSLVWSFFVGVVIMTRCFGLT